MCVCVCVCPQESIDEVTSLAYKVKKKIEGIDADNEAAKKLKGQGQGSASERTRTTVTAGLRKKFKEQMGEFSDLRNRIHEEYRELVERRMYTVTGTWCWAHTHTHTHTHGV